MNTVRSQVLDAIRGGLVILMVIYHGAYIAVLTGLSSLELYQGFWWIFPRTIAAGFVAVSGWSLAGKKARGSPFNSFLARAVRLALPALAITVISAVVFRKGFVFFGILHLLAASSILLWPFLGRPVPAIATGLAVMAGGLVLGNQRFDMFYLAWLGFRPAGLYPVDYLPLLPWFAWGLFGAGARELLSRLGTKTYPDSGAKNLRTRKFSVPGMLKPLQYAGRYSLPIYLIHLPALYGLALLLARLIKA